MATVADQTSEAVPDVRLAESRGVHTPWTLASYSSLSAWKTRAAQIRRHILVVAGLYPLPEKRPLNARIFGRVERLGYSVEKVFFESLPGFLVCGNLYRPSLDGPHPGIACPHGHCRRGRLENDDATFGSIPGRCINLARQGHVVFSYDMAGYNDSSQIEHREFGGRREDLWGIGVLGLQLWNSIRVVDFLQALPGVDPNRIGCTGASGGGTQTFLLAAVDDRVGAAAPVNMISAHMQGGCNCENQGHLRLDINNVEIAAAMAPRPLFLVSASGDWTCNTPELEYPAIREIYSLYDAADRVATAQVDAGHNYNRESREFVYRWFGRWLLGRDEPFTESAFTVEPHEGLLVFHRRKPPAGALDADGVTDFLIGRSESRLGDALPDTPASLRRFRARFAPALRHAVAAGYPKAALARDMGRTRSDSYIVQRLLIGRPDFGDRVPARLFLPRSGPETSPGTLLVHPGGDDALSDTESGRPGPAVGDLLRRGHRVLTISPFLVGASPSNTGLRDTGVPHFHTYNPSDASCRIQDILTAMAFLRSREDVTVCHLAGVGEAGLWCLFARALATGACRTIVDGNRFRASDDAHWAQHLFIPAIRAAGDLRTAAALIAPGPLYVHNAGSGFPIDAFRSIYRAAKACPELRICSRRVNRTTLHDWLTRPSPLP
ncbi:MAG: hypothetical protein OXU79_17075 [Gemmatimonadota bacterium]|nr:hypothetical protein [Gemmatimonadota bacterium]